MSVSDPAPEEGLAIFEVEGDFCPLDALILARKAFPAFPSVISTSPTGQNVLSVANQHDMTVTVDAHKMTMTGSDFNAPLFKAMSTMAGGRLYADGEWSVSATDDTAYKVSQERVDMLKSLIRPFPLAGGKQMAEKLDAFHRIDLMPSEDMRDLLRRGDKALTPFITFAQQESAVNLLAETTSTLERRGFLVTAEQTAQDGKSGILRVLKGDQSAHVLVNKAQADDIGCDYIRHRPEEFAQTGLVSIPVCHSMSGIDAERVTFLHELKRAVAPFNYLTIRQMVDQAILYRTEDLAYSARQGAAYYASTPSAVFSAIQGGGAVVATQRSHFSSVAEQINAKTQTDVVAELVRMTLPEHHAVDVVRDHAGHTERDLVRIHDTRAGEIAYLHIGDRYASDHDALHTQALMNQNDHVLFSVHSRDETLRNAVLSTLSETTLSQPVHIVAHALARDTQRTASRSLSLG